MKKNIWVMLLLVLYGVLKAQNEWDTVWTKSYGGNDVDWAKSVAVDSNGYYVVVGFTRSFGAGREDLLVLRVDPQTGDTLWMRVYGDTLYDYAEGVAVDQNGYYVVVGSKNGPYTDVWVLKIDPQTGDTIWTRTYGGSSRDGAWGVAIDQYGYYIVVGYTSSYSITPDTPDVWILKIDPQTGDTLWTKTYGSDRYDEATAVAIDRDNYYIVSGELDATFASPGFPWVLKISPQTGDTVWTFSYILRDGPVEDIAVDSNDNYVALAHSYYYPYDIIVIKLNSQTGGEIWTKYYDIDSLYQYGYGVAVNREGNYIVAGTHGINPSGVLILKIDYQTGDTLWKAIYGMERDGGARDITIDRNGYYVISGSAESLSDTVYDDVWILKLYGLTTEVQEMTGSRRIKNDFYLPTLSGGVIRMGSEGKGVRFDIFSVNGRKINTIKNTRNFYYRINGASGIYLIKTGKYNKKMIVIK